jgi:hypothetical protein
VVKPFRLTNDFIYIELETGRKYHVTRDHIYYVRRGDEIEEVRAKDLKAGDVLDVAFGMPNVIKSIRELELATPRQTYCLHVDEYHNFALADGTIVHNCDGAAIAALLVGMFCYLMTYLVDAGRVYITQAPLYKQNGKYIRPGEEDLLDREKPFQRFKGLGELNPDEAYDVFFGEHQKLMQLTTEGLEDTLNLLTSTELKKKLMYEHGILQDFDPGQ